eukprot:GHVL01002711.1.p1 GENE.GHVL01002711.1~~GHVL01002711.1.p1  ORF type:complete len:365 (+),score=41.16 GHVL01002711.1:569-1663(+)
MTGAIIKFQRILGIKVNEGLKNHTQVPENLKPIIFISHMEHHSNQTSWLETIAKVVLIISSDNKGLPCLKNLQNLIDKYAEYSIKIAAITACSNVTGIKTNYHKIARKMHQNNGLCFVDFACSAPYVNINMHPDEEEYLDAITFSPHKFLGGPGSSGVLIFNKKLYKNLVPDSPGGGTVSYTNPWGDHNYIKDIEAREDGGTPGFIQVIRVALSIQLKEEMGVKNILDREHALNKFVFKRLTKIKNIHILAKNITDRLSIFSFYMEGVHYNLVVKILNDRFGIQTRGGCSCAGTYGHYLLNVDQPKSKAIEQQILAGCLVDKPGWVRMSLHPTMTNLEVEYICNAIEEVCKNIEVIVMSLLKKI